VVTETRGGNVHVDAKSISRCLWKKCTRWIRHIIVIFQACARCIYIFFFIWLATTAPGQYATTPSICSCTRVRERCVRGKIYAQRSYPYPCGQHPMWSGGVVVTRDSTGRWLESRPFRVHVITLGKLFTYMHPCHQAVYFGSGQEAVMPCGWVGNRRSSVALAMRYRRKCFIHRRVHGLDREMSTPRTLSCGVWPTYLYVLSSHSAMSRFTIHSVLKPLQHGALQNFLLH